LFDLCLRGCVLINTSTSELFIIYNNYDNSNIISYTLALSHIKYLQYLVTRARTASHIFHLYVSNLKLA
jgi:hypothetical protein